MRLPRIGKGLRCWGEMRRYQALPAEMRAITFYAEDASAMKHFRPIVDTLVNHQNRSICYLTSSVDDPVLTCEQDGVNAFYIGSGAVRTGLFLSMCADVCVMSMPDLHTMYIKRSMAHPVHYVYVFHSMVSTHMIYRKHAFDHFDTILCVGPHHIEEIRATEAAHNLPAKRLVEHGYGHLDAMMAGSGKDTLTDKIRKCVLVAPSWGPNGLLETCGEEVCRSLLKGGYDVVVRPHPMTCSKRPDVMDGLLQQFGNDSRFTLDEAVTADSFARADILVSDWSGAALEYAFTYERPVLFVDVPRKVNNPDYTDVPVIPLEITIREEIGRVCAPGYVGELPQQIDRLLEQADRMVRQIRDVRERTVFNVGRSGQVGAESIGRIADEAAAGEAQRAQRTINMASQA